MEEYEVLAEMCKDYNSDSATFDLGPIDGIVMEVTISFSFKEVQEHE